MDLASQLRTSILSSSLPPPSQPFLTSLTTARVPPPPLPSLLATAKARLLACDLTSSSGNLLDASALSALPQAAGDVTVKETRLQRDVFVQVVDVENLGMSRWEQVEEMEAVERGERTRGREVVRVADEEGENEAQTQTQTQTQTQAQPNRQNNNPSTPIAPRNATHRLTLQDHTNKRIYAIELRRIPRIGVGTTCIGEKVLLKAGTIVARGTVLLVPDTCVMLGGKIEAWHEAWMAGRLGRLREAVGGGDGDGR